MLKFASKILIFLCLLNFVSLSNLRSQSCSDVLKLCPPVDELYNMQSMARTYKMQAAQKLKIIHVFYGSTAYHIEICKQDSLGDFNLQVVDYESGMAYWDNSSDAYSNSINISFGSTKRVILEISAVNPEKFKQQSGCLGVVIKYHRQAEESEVPGLPAGPDFMH